MYKIIQEHEYIYKNNIIKFLNQPEVEDLDFSSYIGMILSLNIKFEYRTYF